SRLVEGGVLELGALLGLLQTGPAAVMGWEAPSLMAGRPADLVLLDLAAARPVEPAGFLSKAKFSPWAGESLRGWPMMTFVRGERVFERARQAEVA
ncbi:MAG TPA: dihydroorotase, partial [Trueperaceae bacterium]